MIYYVCVFHHCGSAGMLHNGTVALCLWITVVVGGTGLLFFEFFRILNLLQKLHPNCHLFWLFENVVFMSREDKTTISRFLEVNSTRFCFTNCVVSNICLKIALFCYLLIVLFWLFSFMWGCCYWFSSSTSLCLSPWLHWDPVFLDLLQASFHLVFGCPLIRSSSCYMFIISSLRPLFFSSMPIPFQLFLLSLCYLVTVMQRSMTPTMFSLTLACA